MIISMIINTIRTWVAGAAANDLFAHAHNTAAAASGKV
jgi:hypothetical protein